MKLRQARVLNPATRPNTTAQGTSLDRSPSCAIALSHNPTDLLTFRAAFFTFFAAPLAVLLAFLTVDDRARFAIKLLLFPSAWTSLVGCDSLTAAKCRMLICEVILNFAGLLRYRIEVGGVS